MSNVIVRNNQADDGDELLSISQQMKHFLFCFVANETHLIKHCPIIVSYPDR